MRLLLFSCLITLCSLAFAQTSGYNNALRLVMDETGAQGTVCDLLVQGSIPAISAQQQAYNYKLNYYAGDIASITCNINIIPALLQNKVISYAEYIVARKQLLSDTMLYRNRLKGVKVWTAPLPQAYNGEGMLVGIIDSGIDFNHPDLQDAQGKTRVRYLWEQSQAGGSTIPQPFNYGIEWTKAQIDNGACTHNDLPHFGHGTFISGVAAGNGQATGRFEGCAPKADMVVVALNFARQGPTIADALNYIFTKANALGKPCAVNISVGDYYGSHDGTDLEAKLIDNMLKNVPGRAVAAAAGNAGSIKFHVKTQPAGGDTLFTWLSNSGGTYSYWCYGDTMQVKNLQISVGANRGNLSDVGRIGFKNYNYALSAIKKDTLRNSNNQRIGIVRTSASINSSGVYELFVQIMPDTASLLWRIETKGSGLHHAWNFEFVSGGLPTVIQYPKIAKYAMPDSMYSIVSSFQCSDHVTTVANYCNRYSFYDVRDSLLSTGLIAGSISPGSSSGPTRDGRVKPDVAATGDGMINAIPLAMLPNLIANAPTVVAQDSMHVIGGGTSAASPIAAGLAALYLQRYPTATSTQVRDAIRLCAYQDSYTGTAPNYQWGFGKIDGKATMYCGETPYNGISEKNNNVPTSYPNPFSDRVSLRFEKPVQGRLSVYNINGQLLLEDVISGTQYELNARALPGDPKGLMLVRIVDANGVSVIKVIREIN